MVIMPTYVVNKDDINYWWCVVRPYSFVQHLNGGRQ